MLFILVRAPQLCLSRLQGYDLESQYPCNKCEIEGKPSKTIAHDVDIWMKWHMGLQRVDFDDKVGNFPFFFSFLETFRVCFDHQERHWYGTTVLFGSISLKLLINTKSYNETGRLHKEVGRLCKSQGQRDIGTWRIWGTKEAWRRLIAVAASKTVD